jgi:hypothetical protein
MDWTAPDDGGESEHAGWRIGVKRLTLVEPGRARAGCDFPAAKGDPFPGAPRDGGGGVRPTAKPNTQPPSIGQKLGQIAGLDNYRGNIN